MSDCAPIASRTATAKIFKRIPSDVADAFNFCRIGIRAKFPNGMVRPCSCSASDKLARGTKDKEHAMSQTLNAAIRVVGIACRCGRSPDSTAGSLRPIEDLCRLRWN